VEQHFDYENIVITYCLFNRNSLPYQKLFHFLLFFIVINSRAFDVQCSILQNRKASLISS